MTRMISILLAMAFAAAAHAQSPGFVSAGDAMQRLADGQPWAALTPEGRRAAIVFANDGTGQFRGPLTLSLTWRVVGETLCLDISIFGRKCLRLREVPGGYQGWLDDKLDLTLTR
jgi:hypothetical protein